MSCYALETPQPGFGLHIAKIQKLTGQTGQLDQDQKIYKITIPRDDLKILMSGMPMSPDRGLSSWVTFKKTNNQTSVNGDLILLQDQINPVMSVALTNGLQVTGLHNPYLWDSPRVMFMHIIGEGDELQLASAIGQVLKKIKATSSGDGDFPLGNFGLPRTTLSTHKIDVILGQTGQFKDDVYKIEFSDGIKSTDTEASKVIALNTWAAFAGSDNEAVVNGTLVLHESELQKALVKLRNAQIYILAIYQPRVNDDRDLVLINFWGVGNTQTLAKALRAVFVIAQNNNPANITVEKILPAISAPNAETAMRMAPVQLSFYKNDNCGYVKAKELYTSIDTIQNRDVDYAKQLSVALRIALNLTQKIALEKMTKFVSFLPVASQMIQSTEKNAQVLPSARNLLLKLSVVSNNVPELVKLLALTPIITPVELDTAVVRDINEFAALYINASQSVDHTIFTAVTNVDTYTNELVVLAVSVSHVVAHAVSTAIMHVYANINKFAMLSADVPKSFANVASAAVAHVHADTKEFLVFSVNVSKVLVHATSFSLLKTTDFTHAYATGFITSLTQSFSLVRNAVTQLARSSASKTAILLMAMKKPVPSAVNLTAQKKAVDMAKRVENTFNNIVQVTPKIESLISSVKEAGICQPEKATVKVPLASGQSHNLIAKSLSATLPVSQHKVITAPTAKIVPASLPMPQHKVIRVATLSPLSSVIPVTHHKVKAVPVMQHNILKVAKLSSQSLPYPQSRKSHPVAKVKLIMKPLASLKQTKATQYRKQPNKVQIHAVAQHKNMKLAKLSSSSLLHAQSISNHNISKVKPVAKPATSCAHTKTVKHRGQLNKKLFVTLSTAYHKHTQYAPNRVAIYPVTHHISHQFVRKIAEKSHEIAYTMPHEKDWNTEKLAPGPPIRVAHQQVYREQEEFDEGPALVGAYPYDEEPAEGGFGA